MEIGQYVSQDEQTVFERYLGLTTSLDKIIKIGEPLPLLLLLIRKCGKGDCVVVNYKRLAEECRVSAGTIKGWGKNMVIIETDRSMATILLPREH